MSIVSKRFRREVLEDPLYLTYVACAVLFFVFFRPRYALTGNYISFGAIIDDATYVHHLIGLSDALGITSAISDRWLDAVRQYSGPHPPGIAVLWLPAAILARGIHWLGEWPYSELLVACIGILNWFYFCLAMFLFLKYSKPLLSLGSSLALFLTIPILYYATHRTTMTHPGEAVLCLLFLSEFVRGKSSRKSMILQMLLLVLLAAIRYQYAGLIPFYFLLFLWDKSFRAKGPWSLSKTLGCVVGGLFVAGSALLAYRFWPATYVKSGTFSATYHFHISDFRWAYSWLVPLVDPSWGILYLSGGACVMIAFSLGKAFRSLTTLNWRQIFAIAWVMFPYVFAWLSGKQGDDVQYRFLVPVILSAPFLIVLFSTKEILLSRVFLIWNGVSCCLTLLLVWMVKTKEYLTVARHGVSFWMTPGWHNFWLIPKMIYGIITTPIDLIRPVALSPVASLVITALPGDSLNKYSLGTIPACTLVLMITAHVCACVWVIHRVTRKQME